MNITFGLLFTLFSLYLDILFYVVKSIITKHLLKSRFYYGFLMRIVKVKPFTVASFQNDSKVMVRKIKRIDSIGVHPEGLAIKSL